MNFSDMVLRSDERAIYSLRELYRKFGYSQFKVGRFEEYDLYAHNKSFLVSENILTFTDTNGKLMALKPDVTLSIVKNVSANEGIYKLYYNENVYRTSAESHGFKEIMQTGLECIGNIDMFAENEVIMLAIKSLESISGEYILDISHMGIMEGLLSAASIDESYQKMVLELVKSKNVSGLRKLLASICADEQMSENICNLAQIYLPLRKALSFVKELVVNNQTADAYAELEDICDTLALYGLADRVYFDFSVVNDCNYYDGVVFKGFINGIPDGVLSGGRYDRLIERMGKKCGAIGFAVYLDMLERFGADGLEYDVDVLLMYDTDADKKTVIDTVKLLNESGKTVKTASCADSTVRYRQLLKIGKGGIEILETND